MIETMLRWSMRTSRDLVVLRKRIEQASQILGVGALARTRWATAASDVGRAVLEAGGGEAVIGLADGPPTLVLDLVTPGLIEPGIVEAARRLVGDCRFEADLAGTEIRLRFSAPGHAPTRDIAARLRTELPRASVGDDVTALHSENRRLETAMAALRVAKQGRERLLSVHRTMLEVMPDVVWRSDDSGRLQFVNPRWSALTGRGQTRPGHLLDVVLEADRPMVEKAWQAAISTGEPLRFECRIARVRGGERWVLVHGRPHQQAGARREWIGVLTDIHDTKLREIEQARLIEFRDRMVGVVGHDLRSPLWFIGTASRMLLDQGDDPERRARYLRQIVDNVDRSRRMIDALLDYTRTQLGADLLAEKAPIDVVALIQTLAEQARITHPDRSIAVEGPSGLVVQADEDRLMQAVSNLVGNALSYGDVDAPIELRVSSTGVTAHIAIRNRAEPIPPESIVRIFEPFSRAREDGRNGRGLGLGLYIVRAIARAHGGEAYLESSADGWVQATIALPISGAPPTTSVPIAICAPAPMTRAPGPQSDPSLE